MDKLKELHFWAMMLIGPILIIWSVFALITNVSTSLIVAVILLVVSILSLKIGKNYEHSADAIPKYSRYYIFVGILLVTIYSIILWN